MAGLPVLFISTILETPVTDQAFLEQLHELNNKINAVKEQAFRETMACTDVADILDKLKTKVRIRAPGEGHSAEAQKLDEALFGSKKSNGPFSCVDVSPPK